MISRLRASAAWLGLAGLLALSGCSDNPTSPESTLTQQDADLIAAQLATSLSSSDGGAMVEIDAARDRAVSPAAGGFPTTASAETTFWSGDVNYTLTVTFYDAGGTELPGWDPTAVRMAVSARATGTFTSPQCTTSVAHSALHDVTGIEQTSDRLTFTGDAQDTLEADFTDLEPSSIETLDWRSATDWEDVVALKNTSANPYPLSGRLVWTAVADALFQPRLGQQVLAHHEVTAWVTFNGTRYPEIVVDGTYHYRADLETGTAQRV